MSSIDRAKRYSGRSSSFGRRTGRRFGAPEEWRDLPPPAQARIDAILDELIVRMPKPEVLTEDPPYWTFPLLSPEAFLDEDEVDEGGQVAASASTERPRADGEPRGHAETWQAAVFPDGAGFEVEEKNTGRPPGRPRRGTNDPARARSLIEERAGGRSVQELTASLGRGRPSPEKRVARDVLAQIVTELRRERRATPEAIAETLGCDRATVYRLEQTAERRAAQTAERRAA
jgi:hypothetical protein